MCIRDISENLHSFFPLLKCVDSTDLRWTRRSPFRIRQASWPSEGSVLTESDPIFGLAAAAVEVASRRSRRRWCASSNRNRRWRSASCRPWTTCREASETGPRRTPESHGDWKGQDHCGAENSWH